MASQDDNMSFTITLDIHASHLMHAAPSYLDRSLYIYIYAPFPSGFKFLPSPLSNSPLAVSNRQRNPTSTEDTTTTSTDHPVRDPHGDSSIASVGVGKRAGREELIHRK